MTDVPTVLLSRVGVAGANGPAEIAVPKQIGPVRLLRQIGAGAMGVVWLGHHDILARDVAVKFLLSPDATPGEGPAFDAFIQGARAAAAVRSEGLTAVHDAGAVSGVPYIVMEYVDGPTLDDVLRQAPLPLNIARRVLAEVCEAVAELHERDLVHRDLKPSNIMVSPEGAMIVTDFGLACPRPAQGSAPGPIAGTAPYMAPEMFEGEVSTRSDVYALGVMAFELLAGRLPYEGSFHEVRAAATAGAVPRAPVQERAVPEGVIEAIERAMNKDALFRPKTVRRLAELFEAGFQNASVAAASREQVQELAFPGARPAPSAKAPTKPGSTAATMYDLVAAKAQEKRRSDAAMPPPEATPPPDPKPLEALPTYSNPQQLPVTYKAIPAARPPQPIKSKPRRYKPPVPWTTVLTCALGGSLAVIGVGFSQLAIQSRGPSLVISPAGSVLAIVIGSVGSVLALVLMLFVFHKLALRPQRRRSPDGAILCGWCAYDLRGTPGDICPECGHATNDRGSPKHKPPSRRWAPRFYAFLWAALMMLAFFMGGLGLAGVVAWATKGRLSSIAAWALVLVPTCIAGLLAYYATARTSAMFDGLARCGLCGAEAHGGKCLNCSQAASAAR